MFKFYLSLCSTVRLIFIFMQPANIFTARKRSLRRLCFYRCLSFCPQRGACMVAPREGMRGCSWGGMRGCSRGHPWLFPGGRAWLLPGGHAWLLPGGVFVVAPRGACMVTPRGHVWLLWGGMCGCSQRVRMVALGGMCGCSRGACVVALGGWLLQGGCAWLLQGGIHGFSGGHAWFF